MPLSLPLLYNGPHWDTIRNDCDDCKNILLVITVYWGHICSPVTRTEDGDILYSLQNEGYPNVPEDFSITEKVPTRAFSWLKAATTAFTFKTLLRHYAKQTLTPRSLNVKLGPRRNYHKGRAAIRHYANLREPSDSLCFKL